jgi:PAS domain S-box-containing protein
LTSLPSGTPLPLSDLLDPAKPVFERTRIGSEDVSERMTDAQRRVALETVRLGVWIVDLVADELLLDARAAQLFDLDRSLLRTVRDLIGRIHPDERSEAQAAVRRAAHPDQPDAYEQTYRMLLDDGTERWVEVNARMVFRDSAYGRTAVQLIGTVRDVDERFRQQEALRESEERLRGALEAADLGSWAMRPPMDTANVDQRGREMFGLHTSPTNRSSDFFDRIHPDHLEDVQKAFARSLSPDDPTDSYAITYRTRPSPGVERWVDARGLTYFEGEGAERHVVRFTGVLRDVTRQKQTEQALRESEERMRTLFERIDEGYCLCEMVLSADGTPQSYRYLEVNPLFEHMTGLTDAVGKTIHELAPTIEPHWVETYTRVAFEGETVRFEQESPALGRWFDVFATPAGPHGRFAVVFRDTTERHRAEAEIAQREAELRALNETLEARVAERTEQLEQRNRDLRDFAHAASHDLQEPLRKISVFAGMITDNYADRLDEQGRYFLDRVRDAAQRLSTLVRDLLAYSRVASGTETASAVDLNAVVQTVLEDLELATHEAGAQVHVDSLPTLQADGAQMYQLLQNLIENAVKYRRPGQAPAIRVWAEQDEAAVRLLVRDDGIGIAEQHRERIFAPFGRLHGRGEYPGTGIGLAVCRRIAERHGGSIAVESTEGGGSTFAVTLPRNAPLMPSD